MALTTYAELKTSIANWLYRADLTSIIPDFITIAEKRITRDLSIIEMESTDTGTFGTGENTIDIPAGMSELRMVIVEDYSLLYVPPAVIQGYTGLTGLPDRYTILNGKIQVAPDPADAYTWVVHYLKMPLALSDSNTSNWLFASTPDLYLYASLLAAAPYLMDDGRVVVWGAEYQRIIDGLHDNDRSKRLTTGRELRMTADGHPNAMRVDVPAGMVVGPSEAVWAP